MNALNALNSVSWTSASLFNLTQGTSGGAEPQAADGQSFQSLLAQATAGNAESNDGANTGAAASAGSFESASNNATSGSPSVSQHDRSSVAGSWSKTTEHVSAKSTSRPANSRTGRPALETRAAPAALASPMDTESNAANSDSSGTAQPASASPLGSKNEKAGVAGSLSVTGLPGSAVNALGGTKALSGVAFAMHITPPSGAAPQTNSSSASAQAPALENAGMAGDLTSASAAVQLSAPAGTLSGSAENAAATMLPAMVASNSTNPLPADINAETSTQASNSNVAEVGETEAPEETSGSPQTVRTVQVQLTGEGDGRVDLRMVEHSGGLSVSVRASDSTLTKNLQDNLADLNSRLTEAKYQTQSFVPSVGDVSGGSTSNSSNGSSGQEGSQDGNPADRQPGAQGGGSSDNSGGTGSRSGQGQQQARDDSAGWRQLAALARLTSSTTQGNS